MEELLDAKRLARILGVSENWIYDQAANGDLPSFKFGGQRRFRASEVEAWLEQHRARPEERRVARLRALPEGR